VALCLLGHPCSVTCVVTSVRGHRLLQCLRVVYAMPPPLLAPKLRDTLAALAAADAKRAPAQAPSPQEPAQHDTFLRGAYRDREQLRLLGAEFDTGCKEWYVPRGVDLRPFRFWLPSAPQDGKHGPPPSCPSPLAMATAQPISVSCPVLLQLRCTALLLGGWVACCASHLLPWAI
jgi:hypothetical protein